QLFADEPHSALLTRLLISAPSLSIALLAPPNGVFIGSVRPACPPACRHYAFCRCRQRGPIPARLADDLPQQDRIGDRGGFHHDRPNGADRRLLRGRGSQRPDWTVSP